MTFCPFQICANLDSAIVSTKNYVSELKERVPRPIKTYDIVDKRPEVSRFGFWVFFFYSNEPQQSPAIECN